MRHDAIPRSQYTQLIAMQYNVTRYVNCEPAFTSLRIFLSLEQIQLVAGIF